ncbi:sensor histidine kinase [Brachybacterium tyrofermentans]|uniref:sensor histidine kinase n=1 Tax=Brachybacterium tyrofermentans TaxID=47848 RepID=UPI003FD24610
MTPDAGATRAVALATALVCWVVTLALLVVLPAVAAADAVSTGGAVHAGTAADGGLAALMTPVGSPLWWAVAATLTLQCATLLGLRGAPRTTLLVVTALALVLAVPAPGVAYTLSHIPVLVAVFVAAPRRPWPEMRLVLPVAALAVALGTLLNGLRSGLSTMPGVLAEALVQGLGIVGITALVALALASIRTAREAQRKESVALGREREALERERDAAGREREALTRAAASEERAAMARELHDIAAHHLSGIAVVAAAADRQIETDPQAAHESVRQVRSQTRSVLDDIRRVVGLLRGGEPAERSVTTLATVPELITARADAGMHVRLEQQVPADGRALGDGVGPLSQLVAYRMIQESLTNAAMHAPGTSCLVTVEDADPARLVITVRDDGTGGPSPDGSSTNGTVPSCTVPPDTVPTDSSPSGGASVGGYGLAGMRERADLIGARLEHGPTADGGWQVRLSIPRDRVGSSDASDASTTSGPENTPGPPTVQTGRARTR